MFKPVFLALALTAIAVSSASTNSCGEGENEMSVQGVSAVFCVASEGCAGTNSTGVCPEAQNGLEFGSYCELLETGVFGCKPFIDDMGTRDNVTYSAPLDCTGNIAGEFPVSVETTNSSFCSFGPVCSGDVSGSCPGAQDGLPDGSQCAVIETGVFGCVLP